MDNTFATICSLLPFQLVESKPGLHPNEFIIDKAPDNSFSLTIIPNNVFHLVNPDPLSDAKDVRNIKVPVSAMALAQSIINDYINALLGASPPDVIPGLFAVNGDYSDKKEFATKFMKEMIIYRNAQNN